MTFRELVYTNALHLLARVKNNLRMNIVGSSEGFFGCFRFGSMSRCSSHLLGDECWFD